MLKYLWMVIQDLFVTVTIAALMYSLLKKHFNDPGKRSARISLLAGTAAAIALAAVKNTTNKIVSSRWNHYIYAVIVIFTIAFAILFILAAGKKKKPVLTVLTCAAGGILSAVWIFYSLPSVAAYPFTFNTMGNGVLSWYFAQRLIGWCIGLAVMAIYASLLSMIIGGLKKEGPGEAVLVASCILNALYCVCRFFVPWVNRAKWLNWPVKYSRENHGWADGLVRISSRWSMMFIWITAALVLALLFICFMENTNVTDPYDNPAQLRKLRAKGRSWRRRSAALLLFLAFSCVSMSVIKAYDTREIALSEPEVFTTLEDRVIIPMDAVSDGHLHRYEYKTENDVDVRWIVVKKPGSASFGVGLDACEVCGNAGYYERNGQVVCKRCDVVMNINTIGFQGGCNPIPLPYTVEDGNLVFMIEDLMAGEKEFK